MSYQQLDLFERDIHDKIRHFESWIRRLDRQLKQMKTTLDLVQHAKKTNFQPTIPKTVQYDFFVAHHG